MLSIISKRMNKPVYVLTKNKVIGPIWDINPIPEMPKTSVIFSPVVDKFQLQSFLGKKQIKFCHSGNSLDNFVKDKKAKEINWLTHRKRVYEFWKNKGFNIELIEKGYIPYDKREIEKTPYKKDQGIFISRICPDKAPDLAIETFEDVPLYVVGSHEFKDYICFLKKSINGKNINFIPPDNGVAVSLETRDNLLKESKILVHCSLGGMHDYLEYSILDGLIFNCIPLCITPNPEQFIVIEKKGIGKVVKTVEEAKKWLPQILENYGDYVSNLQKFMKQFLKNQDDLWLRWESKLEEICSRLIEN
ncbi:MAG: hypothetical protein KJ939_01435 [Nanoarchaeota archaeon]|nr:hypothetical protein [Nanoarchaeota archaeon]